MMRYRNIGGFAIAAAAILFALASLSYSRADEDDEAPIISRGATVLRDATGRAVIAIEPPIQKQIHLATKTLPPIERPIEARAYGKVLDPVPLSKLNADLSGAEAMVEAARAQFLRSRRLYTEQANVSLREFQTAQATYLTDKARLQTLEQQLRDNWGAEIAQRSSRSRAELVSALIDRREAVAQVTVPAGEMTRWIPAEAEVYILGNEAHPLITSAVYSAPSVDRRMQGQSFFLLIRAEAIPAKPGSAISATLIAAGKGRRGVIVPRSAVVRYAGDAWVYEALDANQFTRQKLAAVQALREGYFVGKGLKPGTRVVISGAQTLLSEELKGQIVPED